MNLHEVMPRRRYPPSLSWGTSVYRILSGAMLSIRTVNDFYRFYDFHLVEF